MTTGVKKIVYTSVQGAEVGNAFSPIVQGSRQTEEDIKTCGLDWAIGRNGIYIEPDVEHIDTYEKKGEIANCAGNGKCAYTTRPELAFAYARLLTEPSLEGGTYNLHGEHGVTPEFVIWNFWTQQLEKVPQVRWAGEEIIFEKYFGTNYAGNLVKFVKEGQSPGAFDSMWGQADTFYTRVDERGIARASFICEDQGEVDVDALLYDIMVPTAQVEINEQQLP